MANLQGKLQYFAAVVSGSLEENLTNIVNTLGEKKRKIEMVWFAADFATAPTNTLYAVAKINQTEVLRFDLGNFMDLDSDTDQYLAIDRGLPMDLELERGDSFEVGFNKASLTPGGTVTIAYRDLD